MRIGLATQPRERAASIQLSRSGPSARWLRMLLLKSLSCRADV